MITLTKHISLEKISIENDVQLYNLMLEIYPPEYHYFWLDNTSWYINSQFSKENLAKELKEKNQNYYFVRYKNEIVGILRLLFNKSLKSMPNIKAVKLHRIYLHQKVQGKGVGKTILAYIEALAKKEGYAILWLEAMEKKPLALKFYKNFGFEISEEYLYEFDLLKKDHQKMIALYKKYEF